MSRPLRLWLAFFPAGALVSALLWRGETAWRGWAGLAWIGWFHWAVPVGITLFLASALLVIRAASPERARVELAGVALALLVFAGAGYQLTHFVLFALNTRSLYLLGTGQEVPFVLGLLLALALLPFTLATLLAAFHLFSGWARLAASFALWIAAVPVASAWSDVGYVEAIKRGGPVPILYLALAALFLPRRAR